MSLETELADAMRALADDSMPPAGADSLASIEARLAQPMRRYRGFVVIGVCAAAVLLVATAVLVTRGSSTAKPQKLVTLAPSQVPGTGELITGELRARFERGTRSAAPAYLVAQGRNPDGDWWAVAYKDAEGLLCEAIVREGGAGESCGTRVFGSGPVGHQVNLGTDSALGLPPYIVDGAVPPDAKSVVAYTDVGLSLTMPAVLVEELSAGFVAYQAPVEWPTGEYRVDTIDATGHVTVDPRPQLNGTSFDIMCPRATPAYRNVPLRQLPKAGDTAHERVRHVVEQRRADLIRQYDAKSVMPEMRYGQVVRDGRAVEAGDYLIRVSLPAASNCPTAPQTVDGVPISFVFFADQSRTTG